MTAPAARRTRLPADQRREQILTAAARLFQRRGYTGVSIDDIGAAVGITGPGLYRHVEGKEQLVTQVGLRLLDPLLAGTQEIADAGSDDPATLTSIIAFTVGQCLAHPAELTVCLRHLWRLDDAPAATVADRVNGIRALWAPVVAGARPSLDPADAGLYIRAGGGLAIGAERPGRGLATDRIVALLATAVDRMLDVPLGPGYPTEAVDGGGGGWTRSSRREQLLDTAIALFRERGYVGVSMAEIAEEVGVTASATYRHFTNKEDLLATGIARAGERVNAGLSEALAHASSAADALDRLIGSYVSICVDNSDLIAVAVTEYHHLPEEARAQRRRRQQLFVEEWTHCLAQTRPDLTPAEAIVMVHAVQGMITEAVRSRQLGRRPHLREELCLLARAVLVEHPGNAC